MWSIVDAIRRPKPAPMIAVSSPLTGRVQVCSTLTFFMKTLYDHIGAITALYYKGNCRLFFFIQNGANPPVYSARQVQPAESGARAGVSNPKSIAGYTGSGYINGATFDAAGDKIVVTASISTAGSYRLKIRYYGAYGTKNQDIYINGAFIGNIEFPSSTGWVEKNAY